MSDVFDRNAPATRGDVQQLRTDTFKFVVQLFEERDKRLTKDLDEREQRMTAAMVASERRIIGELGHATKASEESLAENIAAVDDKYNDLPPRVKRLEGKVFPDE